MEGCSRASVKYVLYQSISSPPNHHKENEECPCFTRSVFLTIEVNKLYYLITSSEVVVGCSTVCFCVPSSHPFTGAAAACLSYCSLIWALGN